LVSQSVSLPKQEQTIRTTQIIVLTFAFAVGIAILLGCILLFTSSNISYLITGSYTYVTAITIMLLAIPFMIVELCLYSIMEGMGQIKKIVAFRIIPSILIIPIVYILTSQYGFIGASYGVFINEILLSIIAIFLLREFIVITKASFQLHYVYTNIVKVALLSLGVGVSWLITDFLIKRFALNQAGEITNGIIQSVAKVTDLYPNIVLAWLTMHLFPVLGGRRDDKEFISATVERTMTIALALIIPIVIFLFSFRPQILAVIYKKEFVQASFYFGTMLITGIPKVFSWVLGVSLLPIGMKRQWFYSSLMYAIIYGLLAFIGLNTELSLYAIPIAFGVSLCFQSSYLYYHFNKNKIKFSKQFTEQIIYYCCITLLLVISLFYNVVLILVILGYIAFCVRYKLFKEIFDKIRRIIS